MSIRVVVPLSKDGKGIVTKLAYYGNCYVEIEDKVLIVRDEVDITLAVFKDWLFFEYIEARIANHEMHKEKVDESCE